MKKYLLGIFAVIIAISTTAFTGSSNSANQVYYWYDLQGNLLSPVPSEFSPDGCTEGTEICSYGHINQTTTPGMNADVEAKRVPQ